MRITLPGTDLHVHPLCLGGNVFGWSANRDESFAVLDAYAEAGGNFIDTADTYSSWANNSQGGESESIIGEWMESRGNRHEMIIATKVGKAPGLNNLRPNTIRMCAEKSLERLRTDRIDLYYAHQDHDDSMADALEAFNSLVSQGTVRYLAASNYTADRLREALDLAAANGWAPYVALQPGYNLMERDDFEANLMPLCVERQLGVLPYYALARGYLTGKYRLGGEDVVSVRSQGAGQFVGERGERVLAALESVAVSHGVTRAAVALAWLATRPAVVSPIASARTVEQLDEQLAMLNVSLTSNQIALLDAASDEN